MKFIRKGGPPHAYSAWCKKVAGTQKEDYRELPGQLRTELLAQLLAEQGWICAYTMKRVGEHTSHVEHIKPETLCRAVEPGSDLFYENLVACFPADGMNATYRYGAQKKDKWWDCDGRDFISPLSQTCEARFSFDIQGNIAAVGGYHRAERTIQILGLDHPTLTADRRSVIEEFIYGECRDEPLSPARAAAAITEICQPDARNRFHEFCIAIRDALLEHVHQLQRLARKRKFARAHKNERKTKRH